MKKIIKPIAVSLCLFAIAGCFKKESKLPEREVVRLPFQFHLSKFVDVRPDGGLQQVADEMAGKRQFEHQKFANKMVLALNTDMFVSDPVALEIRLKDAAMADDKFYFMSVFVDLKATDKKGRVLAENEYNCGVQRKQSFEMFTIVKNAISGEERNVPTGDRGAWEIMLDECTRDIAFEFTNDILDNYANNSMNGMQNSEKMMKK